MMQEIIKGAINGHIFANYNFYNNLTGVLEQTNAISQAKKGDH